LLCHDQLPQDAVHVALTNNPHLLRAMPHLLGDMVFPSAAAKLQCEHSLPAYTSCLGCRLPPYVSKVMESHNERSCTSQFT
jgi:hypothetical protein